jgi:hypothetical protein
MTYYLHETRKTFWRAVFGLIGHLLGTAVIFISLITLGWGISFVMHSLHGVHEFPEEILEIFTKFELCLTYLDIALCSIFLFAGARHFYREVMEI